MINGRTRVCGLIGKPVEHTMSPLIHNTLAERLGLSMVYVPFLVEEDVEAAVKGGWHLNIQGMNVTVPYKSTVMKALSQCDQLALKIGAVNTLVRAENGFKGYNTDISGLYRAMVGEGIRIEGEEVILLGAGGAARAVAFLLASHKARAVYILNRSLRKAQMVADEVNRVFERRILYPMALSDFLCLPGQRMLCIQATSVGLAPHDDEVVIEEEAFYKRVHTGYDLIYHPANTRFMQLVRLHGGQAYHGLKMLLYQAIEAFELWNEVKITEDLALFVYERMKEEMGIKE